MGPDSPAGGYERWRGCGRATSVFAIALTLTAALVAGGCGGSGHGAETDPEKGSDAQILNEALGRELTMLDVYTRGRPLTRGRQRALERQLRAEEQEYVDALTKAIRGLGGDTEAEAEDARLSGVETQAAFLALASELENEAVEFYVDQAARLYTSAPRTLDAWLAAGHGQHLALLPHREG